MKRYFLKKAILEPRQQVKKHLAAFLLSSLILNSLFLFFLPHFHDSLVWLCIFFSANLLIGYHLLNIQYRAYVTFSRGKFRILWGTLASLLGIWFPPYSIYLYYLALRKERSVGPVHSFKHSQLLARPISVFSCLALLTLLMGRPSENFLAKITMGPEIAYLGNISIESYKVFKVKKDFEEGCVNKADGDCYLNHFSKSLFPATNTGIILATATDSLLTFKIKERNEKVYPQERVSLEAAFSLLKNQKEFVKENFCSRVKATSFIGPISLLNAPFGGYVVQIADTLISRKYDQLASEKLGALGKQLGEKPLPPQRGRQLASLRDFYSNPKKRCL